MTAELTQSVFDPPIAPEVELTEFSYMPLEILRLRRSKAWLICKRRPELAFYLINLWTAAWHERPAGSLEDDDDVLADLAMCPPKDWARVREEVLRGWVKCTDRRLYHPVVVEKVREAWRAKMQHAYDRECGRLRKSAERSGQKSTFVPPTFEAWDAGRASSGQAWMSCGRPEMSNGRPADKGRTSQECPPENALKGEVREREGRGKGYISGHTLSAGRPPDSAEPSPGAQTEQDAAGFDRIRTAYPKFTGRQDWLTAAHHCHQRILQDGLTWDDLEAATRRYADFCAAGGVSSPQFVLTPAKFFSAVDKPWQQPWEPPPSKGQLRQDKNLEAGRAWLEQQQGGDA